MSTFRVEIEAARAPTVCVDIEGTSEPTEDEIEAAVAELAEQITVDGYLAEFAEEVGWHVKDIERYG